MESLEGSKVGHWMNIISTLFVSFTNEWLDSTFEMKKIMHWGGENSFHI
jgi:hypothetical protein